MLQLLHLFKWCFNNKPGWSHNINAVLEEPESSPPADKTGVCRSLLRAFYDSVVASAILYVLVCWSSGSSERDRKRLNKLVRWAGSVLHCSPDSIEEVSQADINQGQPVSPTPWGWRISEQFLQEHCYIQYICTPLLFTSISFF